jgi:hypothetical protein
MASPSMDYGAQRRVDDYNSAMRSQRPALAAAFLAVVIACHSPTSPTDGKAGSGGTLEHGRLSGVVTIGPNCPGPQNDSNPCPTQPSAYAARKIQVWDAAKKNLLFTVDIDSQGSYLIDLIPATYTIDVKANAMDHTSDLPKVVEIHVNTVTKVDVNIDTGLR